MEMLYLVIFRSKCPEVPLSRRSRQRDVPAHDARMPTAWSLKPALWTCLPSPPPHLSRLGNKDRPDPPRRVREVLNLLGQ